MSEIKANCIVCDKPASLQCPKCVKLKLPSTHFCGQVCFKGAWKAHHAAVHKIAIARAKFRPPPFAYTGPLRPDMITDMNSVPDAIGKPDYFEDGDPKSEQVAKSAKIRIYSEEDIKGVREACRIGREVLDLAGLAVKAGVTTDAIDKLVHDETIKRNAYPSPLNYRFFPKSCCTSVNEVICHGIPDLRPLEEGDIVNIDISVFYNGYHGDLNETYLVGECSPADKKLIKATFDSLQLCIDMAVPGVRFRDFGNVITKFVRKQGFKVVRAYCGHGIGTEFHCAPNVPHYAKNKAIGQLRPGMIFTIEPMINVGSWKADLWPDDWTAVTVDGAKSAQFEHTMLVTETGVELLTGKLPSSPKYFWEVDAAVETKTK